MYKGRCVIAGIQIPISPGILGMPSMPKCDTVFFEPARHPHGAFYVLGLVGVVACSNPVAISHSKSGR